MQSKAFERRVLSVRRVARKQICVVLVVLCAAIGLFGQVTAGNSFTEFRIKDVGTILIPDIMELQAGEYKKFSDAGSKSMGYDVSGDIIFQQKGLNEFKFKEIATYARVMISTEIESVGSYSKLAANVKATPREIKELDTTLKEGITSSFVGTGITLLRWDGTSIVKVNGQNALRFAYLRQLDEKPSVYVETISFQNNDRIHRLTISYRLQDAAIWKEALDRTKNSFKITNIR